MASDDQFEAQAGRPLNVDALVTGVQGGELEQVVSFTAPGNVVQMEYSPEHELLFLRNSGTALHIVDTRSRITIETRLATRTFTDMSLTPDGRYLYVTDFGGTPTSGSPTPPHSVHRYDLAARQWLTQPATVPVFQVEAVDSNRLLVREGETHGDLVYQEFSDTPLTPLIELSRVGTYSSGDIEYDPVSRRILSGVNGSTATDIRVFYINGQKLEKLTEVRVTEVPTYGSSSLLSTDAQYFYYGSVQVEADAVSNLRMVLPEVIVGANEYVALGKAGYYDVLSGAERGRWGYTAETLTISSDGREIWTFEDAGDRLRHYRTAPTRTGVLANDTGAGELRATLVVPPTHGALTLREDGTFAYIPNDGFVGTDTFIYQAADGMNTTDTAVGVIHVSAQRHAPHVQHDDYSTVANTPLSIGVAQSYDLPELVPVVSFAAYGDVRKIAFSASSRLIFALSDSHVRVFDEGTQSELPWLTLAAGQQLTDLDLTADENWLYAIETAIGSTATTTLHRFNVRSRSWQSETIAGRMSQVEAINESRAVVLAPQSFASARLYEFGSLPGESLTLLSSATVFGTGTIEYNHQSQILYAYSGTEVYLLKVTDTLVAVPGRRFSPLGQYTTHSLLSVDGNRLYLEYKQFEALDVANVFATFPEHIRAATDTYAFGTQAYYDARSGEGRGRLPFTTTVMAASSDGRHFWAFDPAVDRLHYYKLVPVTRHGVLKNDRDVDGEALTATLAVAPKHGTVNLQPDGTFVYTPNPGYTGTDVFIYQATDPAGLSSQGSVTITVRPQPRQNTPPRAAVDAYSTVMNQPLDVGGFAQQLHPEPAFSFAAVAGVQQIEHSAEFDLVFARTAAAIHTYRASTGELLGVVYATQIFSDMDLTPDGRYLFAADYGGQLIGSSKPWKAHHVHRFDALAASWQVQYQPRIADRIEAVDRNRVLVQEREGHVLVRLEYFSDWTNVPLVEISRSAFNYRGDFEYDSRTGRLIHGNSGLSSQEISTLMLVNGAFQPSVGTGFYGSAQGYGPTSVLSSDGRYFFYGKLQVEAIDVRNNLRVFPEIIRAATGTVAFGETGYYDIKTGARLGNVGFDSQVWFTSDDGRHVWSADASGKLHRFSFAMPPSGVLANDVDVDGDRLHVTDAGVPFHGTVRVSPTGAFVYTPEPGYVGVDEFSYRVVDAQGAAVIGWVTIEVQDRLPLSLGLLQTTVYAGIPGTPVGRVIVEGLNAGEDVTFGVSDARFEVIDRTLRLKAGITVAAAAEATIALTLSATGSHGGTYTRQWTLPVVAATNGWQNPAEALDVSGDLVVTPEDALLLINDLNTFGARRLLPVDTSANSRRLIDVNGDGFLSPEDIVMVLNAINFRNQTQGEAAEPDWGRPVDAFAAAADGPLSDLLALPDDALTDLPTLTSDHEAAGRAAWWWLSSLATAEHKSRTAASYAQDVDALFAGVSGR